MTNYISFQDTLYQKSLSQKPIIIGWFKAIYLLLVLFLVSGAYAIFTKSESFDFYYTMGVYFGRTALILLGIVILPGILGRFNIQIKVTRIITVYRRYLGILVFILVFIHFSLLRMFPYLFGNVPFRFFSSLFELFGYLALSSLFLLFLTSNNQSVKKLGKWWKRLHRLIYIIVWLLVLHTGLQKVSIWSVFIGVFAVLEMASLLYSYITRRTI